MTIRKTESYYSGIAEIDRLQNYKRWFYLNEILDRFTEAGSGLGALILPFPTLCSLYEYKAGVYI